MSVLKAMTTFVTLAGTVISLTVGLFASALWVEVLLSRTRDDEAAYSVLVAGCMICGPWVLATGLAPGRFKEKLVQRALVVGALSLMTSALALWKLVVI